MGFCSKTYLHRFEFSAVQLNMTLAGNAGVGLRTCGKNVTNAASENVASRSVRSLGNFNSVFDNFYSFTTCGAAAASLTLKVLWRSGFNGPSSQVCCLGVICLFSLRIPEAVHGRTGMKLPWPRTSHHNSVSVLRSSSMTDA